MFCGEVENVGKLFIREQVPEDHLKRDEEVVSRVGDRLMKRSTNKSGIHFGGSDEEMAAMRHMMELICLRVPHRAWFGGLKMIAHSLPLFKGGI